MAVRPRSRALLTLSDERIREELRRVALATEDDRSYRARRRRFVATGILFWLAGIVTLGGAFHTSSLELGSVLLLLGPLVGTFGPLTVAYVFWSTGGEI